MYKLMVVAAILAAALLTPSRAAAIPANDDFDHAAPVGGPPAEVTGTTEGATQQPGESTATALMSVWYAFRPAVAQRVGIEAYRLDESSHPSLLTDKNLVLSVSTGSGLGSLHELGSDDIWDPRVEFDAAAGATYWVRVASNFAERFALRATTTTAPPNDFFSAAQRVKVGVEYSGSFADATTELGEPDVGNHPHSVWFRFRAPHDERITVDSGGSLARNGLVAYTGSDISRLHRVATGVGSSPTGGWATWCGSRPNADTSTASPSAINPRIAASTSCGSPTAASRARDSPWTSRLGRAWRASWAGV